MQIADAHNDFLTTLNSRQIKNYITFAKNNKVVTMFTAYYIAPNQQENISPEIIQEKFKLINTEQIFKPTIENLGFVKTEKDLEKILQLNLFSTTLTWNYDNNLAGGALGTQTLTPFGKKIIKKLEISNILIDTAHLNKASFYDFNSITTKPLFCSHTGSKAINNIPRNLDNHQLNLIKQSKGYVGLCLYNSLLSNTQADHFTILKHLDNLIEYAGEDNVGFGTDFNGTGEQNILNYDYTGIQELCNFLLRYYPLNLVEKIYYKNLINFKNSLTK